MTANISSYLHVYGIQSISLQPASYQRHLAELTEKMSSVYTTSDLVNGSSEAENESAEIYQLVAVYLCQVGQWCRATVVNWSHGDPSKVRVQLLDYGALMLLPRASVHPLK